MFNLLRLCFLSLILAVAAYGAEYSDLIQEAVAEIELGNYDNAARAIEQAFALNSSDPLGHLALGTVYLHAGKLSEAEKEYKLVISANPNEWRAHYALAICALLKGDMQSVWKWVDSASRIENCPDEVSLLKAYLDYVGGKVTNIPIANSALAKQILAMAKIKEGDKIRFATAG